VKEFMEEFPMEDTKEVLSDRLKYALEHKLNSQVVLFAVDSYLKILERAMARLDLKSTKSSKNGHELDLQEMERAYEQDKAAVLSKLSQLVLREETQE
jgi:hypothetical protein